ncbi:diacylglycerol/lipid kinase family protein [Veillonella caviae]|uniref:diacylglycerol/lipid kinase family protein n=1 Tax=Veillonella caviae TaxID=248316 RepID=UPI000F8E5F95|nr:diacylglycerol kinase family protein [Veillonella caviae]MCF0158244.1 diacylglycerol kinase family lipid kinase [Veillonella sp.]MCI5708760.1 diacylglycerol kinase family lipid kinase [Veillonella caviae]MDY4746271.1 diacylglycerol kinase family lipid kinase [Veillonella caviae]MDY5714868.1 diacylglycerol kinase family lipid kinase [Veillonella caviae]MDY5787282.1 diacylglycerol kinase family lipid kinase [Veillonella caviae]
MNRCLVIINPVSGGGAARRYALDLQWKLSTFFDTIEVKFTTGPNDATRFAKAACDEGFDAVFCMGGDGTVNETVNGIAQGDFKCTFGFIPVGTVNDMSRALGIPQKPLEAIKRLDINQVRSIDIGRCNDKYFCNNIAAGVIPKVIEEVTPKEKQILGPLAYFLRAGQALFTTKDYTFRIKTADDDFICKSPLVLALLTNVVSSFERFMPEASVDDGYMRLIIFKEYFILDILSVLPLILSGAIYNSRYTTTLTVKKAHIELLTDVNDLPTNMDGDQGPYMPVDIEVLPQVLKVFAPVKHKKKKSLL